jgi:hypothetical protein
LIDLTSSSGPAGMAVSTGPPPLGRRRPSYKGPVRRDEVIIKTLRRARDARPSQTDESSSSAIQQRHDPFHYEPDVRKRFDEADEFRSEMKQAIQGPSAHGIRSSKGKGSITLNSRESTTRVRAPATTSRGPSRLKSHSHDVPLLPRGGRDEASLGSDTSDSATERVEEIFEYVPSSRGAFYPKDVAHPRQQRLEEEMRGISIWPHDYREEMREVARRQKIKEDRERSVPKLLMFGGGGDDEDEATAIEELKHELNRREGEEALDESTDVSSGKTYDDIEELLREWTNVFQT